ncbi:hypothetical protein Pla110_43520 [Polystyrenella longa]|uniref:Transposase IS701-like DDE domain-containing protein n=1 Tax=Polystyrenella longa TaxID=2528007 RepID=A0A518CTN3_9PLAN|nr:IS701 family transposase [Polystyrenella longa]QDU82592.1 hypothetical protein Pla110_43520 [Polystyrenella longa]
MERAFLKRKGVLDGECRVSSRYFAASLNRLEQFMEPFLVNYRRHEQAEHATTIVQGFCSDLAHKNGESIAYLFGLDRKAIQHFLGESRWQDQPLRKELVRQIGTKLGEFDGVLAFDPSAFAKSGDQSVGVARQWCGRLGKIENCQVAVYMAYISSKVHALVDTQLYLPKEWTQGKTRLKKAGVPQENRKHKTRHELCLELLDQHGDRLPHAWITGDDEMGRPADFRRELRERSERYLLSVPSNTTVRDLENAEPEWCGNGRPPKRPSVRADRWASGQSASVWKQIVIRDGEQGPLVVDALKRRVSTGQRARPTAAEEVLVVIRYRDRDLNVVKTDYYLSNAEIETPLEEFCRAAKAEHRIEECLQRAKGQAGLADYEVRNWVGWHHHQTLSLLANWFLTVETGRSEKKDTVNDVKSSSSGHRFHASCGTRVRYTPKRELANRTTLKAEPASSLLSLETTQSIASHKHRTTTDIGQSN